jgi:hypothetical protein
VFDRRAKAHAPIIVVVIMLPCPAQAGVLVNMGEEFDC